MKVNKVTIDFGRNTDRAFQHMLKRGSRSEMIFDNPTFNIELIPDHPWEFYSRLYYEHNVKRWDKNCSTYSPKENVCDISMSTSDAIDFIYETTPAHLKKDVKDNITTLTDIRDLLDMLLCDDTIGRQEYYHSMFKKIMMMSFDKAFGFDMSGINAIREHVPDGIVVHEFFKTTPSSLPNEMNILIFNCYNQSQLKELYQYISYPNKIHVLDVHKSIDGYYFIAIETNNSLHQEWYTNIKNHSYSWINRKTD